MRRAKVSGKRKRRRLGSGVASHGTLLALPLTHPTAPRGAQELPRAVINRSEAVPLPALFFWSLSARFSGAQAARGEGEMLQGDPAGHQLPALPTETLTKPTGRIKR